MLGLPVITGLTISTVLLLTGSASALRAENIKRDNTTTVLPDYEYIIVGSGAGGGPLAARLAIAGKNVLLIEAGDDQGTTVYEELPALFAPASEYVPMSWDFYVRHYAEESRDAQNTKATYQMTNGSLYIGLDPPSNSTFLGIWYPRAGTLGGCGAHNAMITVYPHESDWDNIKNITGDDSWDALAMRQYFERLEQNQYLTDFGYDESGHGFDGWLGTSLMSDDYFLEDPKVLQLMTSAGRVLGLSNTTITNNDTLDSSFPLDLNTNYTGRDETTQRYRIPMAVSNGARSSPRDFLLATAAAYDTLTIRLNCFVTNIRFDNSTGTPTAVGVDFIDGQSLYSADARTNSSSQAAGVPGSVNATAEVIISTGTFNTPQLLKLSGIGPAAELESFGIDVVSDLPGVGSGLQDHYEISTVSKFEEEFELLSNCTLLSTADDECYVQYTEGTTGYTKGPYATNLLYGSVLQKSSVATVERDTMTVGIPIFFRGYFEGYSELAVADTYHWTWLHLKAHERNLAGTVNLTSTNPFDTPDINFHFFDDGTTTDNIDQLDVQPLVDAMSWARKVNADLASRTNYTITEAWPGPDIATDDEVEEFTKNESWGHHASSSCRIGADDDEMAVLNSDFQVRGVNNLRVVDASVFPQIPGFFIVTAVYMISEKAADVILAAAA